MLVLKGKKQQPVYISVDKNIAHIINSHFNDTYMQAILRSPTNPFICKQVYQMY